ncbi:MAG: efflux RND transporter periplasmic adaptor subunit [Candidatus Hydrogenedentota bacterium]|nr:MAG: efflux RND transporter periplasmic adaptor subunit [Candidatus Hydrogenedentota bacterium]
MEGKIGMPRTAICLLITALLFVNCSEVSTPQGRPVQRGTLERGAEAFPVELLEAREQDVVEWIRGIGSVSADKQVTLGAEVGGRIAEIRVEVGDLVAKGALLARLDDERFRIARDLARAEVEIAEANLENSRRNARRQAELLEDQVASEHIVDQAELKTKIDAGQLKIARAKLDAAERDLSDAGIVSPIDGEITRKHVEVGELIQPGTPLFDIVNIKRVKVSIMVSELEITKVRKGQDAELDVDGYPGVVFHGTVHAIGAEAEPQTRTFPVEIVVVNDRPERLLPGFIGRVRIRGRIFKGAVSLPQEVIVHRDGHPVVFVVASDTASARTVELGFADRGSVIISRGIEPGDKVVVTGQESLRDAAKVSVR